MKKSYYTEIEGMIDFYNELGIQPNYDLNTDGVYNGNLFEFKRLSNMDGGLPNHIDQIKRYLKAYNSDAKDIPSKSYLIYINESKYIEIDNEILLSGQKNWKLAEGRWVDPKFFKDKLNNTNYIKGYIDEYSIVAYNNKFCRSHPKATKEDIKNEFINPETLWIKPFDWDAQIKIEEKSNGIGWLHFNMNLLGNELLKKQLGAFFTPDAYVQISTEYVRNIIKSLKGKPYLIVDRCAGTGNLERFLTKEELSHCVLNTYDYTEWTTLKGLYDGRVKSILPPTHKYRDKKGLLTNGDALSKEFHVLLTMYLNAWRAENKDGVVIFLENPPFGKFSKNLPNSGLHSGKINDKKAYLHQYMIDKTNLNTEYIQNIFIWTAFELYLAKNDHYILYGPIKYWKQHHLIDKKFVKGYLSNKSDYNADTDAGLPLIHWINIDCKNENLVFENGSPNGQYCNKNGQFVINKIHNSINTLFNFIKPANPKNKILAYHSCTSTDIMYGNQNAQWMNYAIETKSGEKFKGKPIDKDNILFHCPIFCAGKFDRAHTIQWYEADVIFKSGDRKDEYQKDIQFLKQCFIFTILNIQNRCISDEKIINECAFNQNTICDKILKTLKLDKDDKMLLDLWDNVLKEAIKCEEFNKKWVYNYSQIQQELAEIKIPSGNYNKKGEMIYQPKYQRLVNEIKILSSEIKRYYCEKIIPKLFKYELLK